MTTQFAIETLLKANSKELETAFEHAGKAGEKLGSKIAKVMEHGEGKLHKFAEGFKEAFSFGGAAGLGAMASEKLLEGIGEAAKALPEFAEKAEAVGRESQKMGLTAEAYQRLAYAFKMTDVPAESMGVAFKKLNVGLAQLRNHQGPLVAGLQRLNPELSRQLRTATNSQDAFLMVAEAVSKTESAQKRAAIATAVFGKNGVDLLPILAKGKEGVADLMNETDKYVKVITTETVEAGAKFSDSMKQMNASMTALTDSILTDLMTALNPLAKGMADFMGKNKGAKDVIEGMAAGALALAAAFGIVKLMIIAWGAVSGSVTIAGLAWEAYALYAGGAATAQEALNLVMAANPIGLVVVAVAALITLVAVMAANWNEIGPFFLKVGQTIMKGLLSPLNLVIGAIAELLDLASNIPGIGGMFKDAAAGVRVYQDAINKTLSGTAGATDYGGVWDTNSRSNESLASLNRVAPAPNASGLAAHTTTVQNNISVNNERAPGTKSTVQSAPQLSTFSQGKNK